MANQKGLNLKQERFVDYYIETGNATESYKRAGYKATGNSAEVSASQLLRNPKIKKYLEERNKEFETERIANMTEVKEFWTEIMRNNEVDLKSRLDASEKIAKVNGAYIDKKDIDLNTDLEIVVGLDLFEQEEGEEDETE